MPRIAWILAAAMITIPLPARTLRLQWYELRNWIGTDKRVRISTTNHVVLVGILREVQEQNLALTVLSSSNRNVYPRGETLLPRSSIAALAVRRETRKARHLGMSIGLASGLVIFIKGSTYANTGWDVAIGAAAAIGVYVSAGYLIGLPLDKRWTKVILEAPPAQKQQGEEATSPEESSPDSGPAPESAAAAAVSAITNAPASLRSPCAGDVPAGRHSAGSSRTGGVQCSDSLSFSG